MVPRWALKYWPDTRSLVDAYMAIDPSNHGTADAYGRVRRGVRAGILAAGERLALSDRA